MTEEYLLSALDELRDDYLAEAAAAARGRGGHSGQAGSSLRTRERCGRRFPSQESASFL